MRAYDLIIAPLILDSSRSLSQQSVALPYPLDTREKCLSRLPVARAGVRGHRYSFA